MSLRIGSVANGFRESQSKSFSRPGPFAAEILHARAVESCILLVQVKFLRLHPLTLSAHLFGRDLSCGNSRGDFRKRA